MKPRIKILVSIIACVRCVKMQPSIFMSFPMSITSMNIFCFSIFCRETFIERLPNESMNDRNDRAIRVAALWYMRKLSEGKPIFLLTNDMANLFKAQEMEVTAKTVHQYIREMQQHPELLDLLTSNNEEEESGANNTTKSIPDSGKQFKKKQFYTEHKPLSEVMQGLTCVPVKYFQGVFFVNRNNPGEATVEVLGLKEGPVIMVKGFTNINRAIHGDVVAVELLPKSQWALPSGKIVSRDDIGAQAAAIEDEFASQLELMKLKPTGQVVGIIKRNWKPYCGSLDEDSRISATVSNVYFVAVDKRIPKIKIRTRQAKELMIKRILVAIETWPTNSKWPEGRYVSTLGDIGDKDTEASVILLEHDIPHYQFSEQVLSCLPPNDWCITDDEVAKRKDLRSINICSIDPPGCKDIDDALHARTLPNGNYEIGVHIADVTHFVKEKTPLDEEACKRSTSVYLVDRRIDMLPKLLTESLCSLVSKVDRLAFSVIWEITPDAKIVNTEFTKSVIRSRASLTYQQAQAIIDDKYVVCLY